MDRFEFILALLALLLGLALTEIASGLASAIKARARIRIGWLTPLAALLICLDIVTMWSDIWNFREVLQVNSWTLIVGTMLCLGYYLFASFVFPDRLDDGMSLDDWFMANRKFSIGGTLALAFTFNLIQRFTFPQRLPPFELVALLGAYWSWAVYIGLNLATVLVASRRAALATMGITLAMYVMFFGILFV